MSIPNPTVDSRFLSTTPILYPADNGHATGFFFIYDGDTYLITNKHVVDRQSVNEEPLQSVRIFVRPNPGDVGTTKPIDIQLIDEDGNRLWQDHPADSTIDVVAIPLRPPVVEEPVNASGFDDDGTNEIGAFNEEHLPKTDEIIVGGRSLIIFGYPYRVSSPYFPVARDALSASPYGFPFRGKPRFMTDAKTHNGISGSPVLTHPSAMQASESGGFDVGGARKAWFLVGVHSSTLSGDIREPLDLNEAWYSTLIPDIIETI